MNEESTQRISKTTAAFMIVVAVLFDLGQVASKILALVGLTVVSGLVAALTCNYLGVDAPKTCFTAGAVTGAVVSFTGIGTVIALKVGMLLSWLVDLAFALVGRLVLYLWFQMRGVSVLSGTKAQKKMATAVVTSLVGVIPYLGTLPDLTVWTVIMIYHARSEDTEKAQAARTRYNDEKNYARMRRPLRQYVPTNIQ